jgi:hypothetical protein
MDRLDIERLGGVAGMGTARSRLRSRGSVDLAALTDTDRAAVERLFEAGGAAPSPGADAFRYRLTRETPQGPVTIEAPHEGLPAALTESLRTELE